MPPNAALLLSYAIGRESNRSNGYLDADHLAAAARWLARAQDAMADGGVAGRWRLGSGWTSSYPETTGYLIPTFLELSRLDGLSEFHERARRAVEFLLRVQLPTGAFPAAEIGENTTQPSVFNSAQIICGLNAWHGATNDAHALAAAFRAADWITEAQDPDGAFRAHFYENVACTYAAHASCWMAELGTDHGIERYRECARRNLAWVLSQVDPKTGWFDLAGFAARHGNREALTHTIAYTVWGVLLSSELLGDEAGIAAAEKASWAIARRFELDGRLPGVLTSEWRGNAAYSCVTGTAQMALIWFRLAERTGDLRYANTALKAIDTVKTAQPMGYGPKDAHGGIPGSDPLWGDYIYLSYPNWAAKFFVDALLEKRRVLARSRTPVRSIDAPIAELQPDMLASAPREAPTQHPRIVLFSSTDSHKVNQFLDAWSAWGFRPVAVVAERREIPALTSRLQTHLVQHGLGWVLKAAFRRLLRRRPEQSEALPMATEYRDRCAHSGIAVHEVTSLTSAQALDLVRELRPDFAIHAGAGILRADLLRIPVFGTLNAHMGLLPRFRGMNVAEWAVILGEQPGCTVHFIDEGIDTGPIIARRTVNTERCRSIDDLRAAVDAEQVKLLGEVVHALWQDAHTPIRSNPQTLENGQQFFRMHEDLRAILEERLRTEA